MKVEKVCVECSCVIKQGEIWVMLDRDIYPRGGLVCLACYNALDYQ